MENQKPSLVNWFVSLFIQKDVNKQPKETNSSRQTLVDIDSREGSPVRAGRQSIPDVGNTHALSHTTIKPDVPFEYLDVLQVLASINPDISYAVENIVQMGMTDYTISFPTVSDSQAKRMKEVLNTSAKSWLGSVNSRTTLIANMFDQLAVNGALSCEPVIKNDLSGIKSIALVNPAQIEYKYNIDTLEWEPYQRPRNTITLNYTRELGGLIKLNPATYTYIPLRQRNEKPYGIPPLLSALEMTGVEGDIIENFKKVAKNIGVLGFLQVLVNEPRAKKSVNGEFLESDTEYHRRLVDYLDNVVRPEAEKGFNTGVMTGFKGKFETEFQPTNSTNINGAEKFLEAITILKQAGLKQDPIFFGRPFNTSEALGRVLLDKFASQVTSYQYAVADALSRFIQLDLILNGFPVVPVEVKFDLPNVKDSKTQAEARSLEIDNAIKLYNQGLLSQEDIAAILGIDKPDLDEPRQSTSPIVTLIPTQQEEEQEVIQEEEEELQAHTQEFDYSICCEHHTFADDGNEELDKAIKAYLTAVTELYDKAVDRIAKRIIKRLSNLSKNASKTQVFDAVYSTLLRSWGKEFTRKQKQITDRLVESAYKVFRRDKAVFGTDTIKIDGKDTKIPKAVFDVLDLRTIDYMQKTDNHYLGKFITDSDTKKRLKQFIYDEFVKGDIPLGQTNTQQQFIRNLANQLGLEKFKIDRIVRTTANKMRSYAAINYLHQVGVKEFEIVALIDNKTSDVCRKMNGKVFSVPSSRVRVLQVAKSQPSSVPRVTPFVTSVFSTDEIDDLDNLTGQELLDNYNIFAPPYHGNCRTQIVAKL